MTPDYQFILAATQRQRQLAAQPETVETPHDLRAAHRLSGPLAPLVTGKRAMRGNHPAWNNSLSQSSLNSNRS